MYLFCDLLVVCRFSKYLCYMCNCAYG